MAPIVSKNNRIDWDGIEEIIEQDDQLEINFHNTFVTIGYKDIQRIEDMGWKFDFVRSFGEGLGMTLMFTKASE